MSKKVAIVERMVLSKEKYGRVQSTTISY